MSKTKLQMELAKIAPNISIETKWETDPHAPWDIVSPDMNPDDYQAWQSEIVASAIVAGALVTGSASLGGTWEKVGDHPAKSNPDISGYELQMTEEALEELCKVVPFTVQVQVKAAMKVCRAQMQARYDEQMAGASVA